MLPVGQVAGSWLVFVLFRHFCWVAGQEKVIMDNKKSIIIWALLFCFSNMLLEMASAPLMHPLAYEKKARIIERRCHTLDL